MKFRNKSDRDLLVLGGLVKAGEAFESATKVENPNFELVVEAQVAPPVPLAPATPPVVPQPVNQGAN